MAIGSHWTLTLPQGLVVRSPGLETMVIWEALCPQVFCFENFYGWFRLAMQQKLESLERRLWDSPICVSLPWNHLKNQKGRSGWKLMLITNANLTFLAGLVRWTWWWWEQSFVPLVSGGSKVFHEVLIVFAALVAWWRQRRQIVLGEKLVNCRSLFGGFSPYRWLRLQPLTNLVAHIRREVVSVQVGHDIPQISGKNWLPFYPRSLNTLQRIGCLFIQGR